MKTEVDTIQKNNITVVSLPIHFAEIRREENASEMSHRINNILQKLDFTEEDSRPRIKKAIFVEFALYLAVSVILGYVLALDIWIRRFTFPTICLLYSLICYRLFSLKALTVLAARRLAVSLIQTEFPDILLPDAKAKKPIPTKVKVAKSIILEEDSLDDTSNLFNRYNFVRNDILRVRGGTYFMDKKK